MNQVRDKFIFKKLNPEGCWHSHISNTTNYLCKKCGKYEDNPDLSTAEGFQEMWGWMRRDKGLWDRFLYYLYLKCAFEVKQIDFLAELIDSPDKFADAVWEFLKKEKG